MADTLTREILKEMSDICVTRRDGPSKACPVLDTVCGQVDGEYQMKLVFRAEPRFFGRLAENMIGEKPESEEEVQEYANEFFNTLCGRFISEIYHLTHIPGRFYPVCYQTAEEWGDLEKYEPFTSVYFLSDQQEYAEFSWPQRPMEELLKRSEKQ